MLHLTFITVGDLPKGPFADIGEEFRKRLTPYVKVEHRVVKSADSIHVRESEYLVVLDENGMTADSKTFAQMIQKFEDTGEHVTVVLGGPKGLPTELKQSASLLLSLSAMTTTHDLAHIFFLEQLYRAFTIIRGKEYHY